MFGNYNELPAAFTGVAVRKTPYTTDLGYMITDTNQPELRYQVWYCDQIHALLENENDAFVKLGGILTRKGANSANFGNRLRHGLK